MDDSPVKALLSSLEGAIKFSVALGAVLYGFGFLTVGAHYSRYNVTSFSLLNADYVVAGLLSLVSLSVLSGITAYYYRRLSKKFKEGCLKKVGLAFAGLFIVLVNLLLLLGPNFRYRIVLAFLVTVLITGGLLYFVLKGFLDEEPNDLVVRKALFASVFSIPLIVIYTFLFGYFIYPRIPRAMGGGKPSDVSFTLREPPDQIPSVVLQREPKNQRLTVRYKLLLVTDKSYVIQQPANEGATYEFPKDAVSGIIFY